MSGSGISIQVVEKGPDLLEANLEDRYLVLFGDDADYEAGPRVLSRALKLKPAPQPLSAEGPVRLLEAGTLRAKAYCDLGLATVSMSREKARELAASDPSARVLRVQSRRLPDTIRGPYSQSRRPAGEGATVAMASGVASRTAVPADPHAAYLLGARDAIDLALSRYAAWPATADARRASPVAVGDLSWALAAIGMGAGGNALSGHGIGVAVIDTGIQSGHPDFAGRLAPDNLKSFVRGADVEDAHGHGTHCAGVVAGPARSTGGMRYGIAPGVDLIVGRVFDAAGRTDDEIVIDAIQWAVSRGARVVSLSLGSTRRTGDPHADAYERVASRLMRREPSVLLVAASGNESRRSLGVIAAVSDPAACPSILAVAAVDERGSVADFSNGETDAIGGLDLSGPGVDVYSSTLGGDFELRSGTSMATPHVAGVAALLMEKNSGASATSVRDALLAAARPLGSRLDYGAGLVQVP